MRKSIFNFIAVVMAAIALASCSGYSKLLKSKDHEKMYQAAVKYYQDKKYTKTLALLNEVGPYFTGTLREDTIQFYSGASYYNQGDFESSGMIFDNFRRTFGRNSAFLEEAEYMYAMGFYYSSPNPERDQSNTIKAMIAISEYIERYPNTVKKDKLNTCLKELQGKLYDKEYINSKLYYKIGKYKSAVLSLRNALDQSPDNPHREEMMYLIAKSGYLLSKNSIPELQKDRYLKMMDYYYNFMSEFPQSKYAHELGKMMDEAKVYVAAHNVKDENR